MKDFSVPFLGFPACSRFVSIHHIQFFVTNHYESENCLARPVGEDSLPLPPIAGNQGESRAVPPRLERDRLSAITAP